MGFNVSTTNYYIILVLSLLVFLLFLYLIFPFLMVIFWAGILAFYLYPLNLRIYSLLKAKKTLSTLFTLFIFTLFIVLPFTFLGILFYYQLQSLIDNINEATLQNIFNYLTLFKERLSHSRFYPYLDPYIAKIQQELPQQIPKFLEHMIRYFSGAVFSTFSLALKLAFTLFTLYYFLADGEKIVNILKELIPGDQREKEKILKRISLILKGVLYGNILTAMIQGFIALIIYYLLGIPQYIFFALLTMIASFIPFLGTGLVWLPLSLYLTLTEGLFKGFLLFILSALTVSQVDNLIKPYLIGEKAKLHNLLVFFAVLGGIAQFGLTGLFLGPVILGFFLSILEIYKTRLLYSNNNSHPLSEN